jgi:protein-S-isoprenylcysteine O-methyltransferase Ste14
MSRWQHIKAILALPFLVLVIIPIILLLIFRKLRFGWNLFFPLNLLPIIAGCIFLVAGLILIVNTNLVFVREGEGTLAPWNPPKKLVVIGIYKHVRNPMILGVLTVLLGEAILFGSLSIFVWFIGFFV